MTNVVQIGDLRITRTERQRFSGCQHKNFTVDPNGDIVTCDDCDKQITSHWALVMLIEEWQREIVKLQRGQAAHAAALAKSVGLKAASLTPMRNCTRWQTGLESLASGGSPRTRPAAAITTSP